MLDRRDHRAGGLTFVRARGVVQGVCALVLLAASAFHAARAEAPRPTLPVLTHAPANYLLGCGGCHGIGGMSRQGTVPDLRGQAGYFLCTDSGRRYVLRLPNVAFANLTTPQLTELMNYVMFTLGAGSAPKGARPFTEAEVEAARHEPFGAVSLQAYRADVVRDVTTACPQAAALTDYGAALATREVRNTP
ncbi:hypothetical protein KGY14_02315 [Ameyamaea chiangmaiensis]|uniref:hypothetical protein n=1 Tax=Ameyamaea chiangmaiensis TaxID=442969 RepID=UPI001BB094DC|nr:hypothetical protein [Ameyamaea chiangmaiensis]MBS4074020.1 hypothetical protein [Ameyamaea chiangmaiensis]